MDTYIAVIGDMKASKGLTQRATRQELLASVLDHINSIYEEHIASKFIITLGDEFQGLLSHIDPIFDIIEDIYFTMSAFVEIRYGIGIGSIETKIDPEAAIGADGPAYHRARDMIIDIKGKERRHKQAETVYEISSDHTEIQLDLINNQLSLLSLLQHMWTDKQRKTLEVLRKNPDDRRRTAQELGISQSSLQRRIKYASYYHYAHTKTTLLAYLKSIGVPHA